MGADEKNLSRGRKVGLAAAALLAAALSCAALTRGCAPAPAPGSDAGSRPAAAAVSAARDGETASEDHDEPAQPDDVPSDEPAADPERDASPQKPADEPARGDKPSKPARGQTSSKPSGGSSSGSTSKPSHKHTWVEQTAQKWVPNNVWVVDKAAWDEHVPGKAYVQCTCGARFNNEYDWGSHSEDAMLNGDFSHSYSVKREPGTTIHHDEVGHWEDRGRNETVVTGYACSGCGATR